MRKIQIQKMTLTEYLMEYVEQYNEGELFDYPLDELDYIIEDTDIQKLALIGDRLYEMN